MRMAWVVGTLVAFAGTTASFASFIPGNLVVSQYGAGGSTALSSAAAPISLVEFATSGGSSVSTTALPSSGGGTLFTGSGSATSEGFLTLSTNGQYLTIGGYNAAAATTTVTTAAGVNRVVARIDWNQTADLSTVLTDSSYAGNSIRSVASTNGTDLWVTGNASSAANAGVRYTTLGSSSATQLSSSPTNVRVVNIFSGQIYTSAASGTIQAPAPVGSGLPTTSGQTITAMPGMPTASGPSAYDYFFASSNILYIADDRSTGSGGGLQKWTLSAGTWSLSYTLNSGLTAGLRGLTGVVDAFGNVTLYATTADTISAANGNKLVSVTDLGAGSAFSTLATAPGNTAFRGVDFAPVPTPGSFALLGLAGALAGRRRR